MLLRSSCCFVLIVFVLCMTLFSSEINGKKHHGRHGRQKSHERRNSQSTTTTQITATKEPTPPDITTTTTTAQPSSNAATEQRDPVPTDKRTAANTAASSTTKKAEVRKGRKYKEVKIKPGKIRGEIIEIEPGKKLFTFLGIPYGQPPTGTGRFKRPVPVKPWDEVKDTLEYPNSCHQWRDNSFEHFEKGELQDRVSYLFSLPLPSVFFVKLCSACQTRVSLPQRKLLR